MILITEVQTIEVQIIEDQTIEDLIIEDQTIEDLIIEDQITEVVEAVPEEIVEEEAEMMVLQAIDLMEDPQI
jgi:hypothetical protein